MAQCITPFHVRKESTWYGKDDSELVPVPCGKCPPCIERRTSAWSFRLMQEGLKSISARFVTLTYDTLHVPITRRGFMTLDKKDVQKYMKRLRKKNRGVSLRYYVCGEYGGKTMRPHYHMILFNSDLPSISAAWYAPPRGLPEATPSPIGDIHYGEVNGASIGYTLKYMAKPGKIPMHQNDDRQKEFSLMSKGLGANYVTEAMKKWHTSSLDDRMHCVLKDGRKISMPRYYKDRIYNEDQREIIANATALRCALEKDEYEREMYKLHGERWIDVQSQNHLQQFQKMHRNATKDREKL